jgi:hypothetical protein
MYLAMTQGFLYKLARWVALASIGTMKTNLDEGQAYQEQHKL